MNFASLEKIRTSPGDMTLPILSTVIVVAPETAGPFAVILPMGLFVSAFTST